MTLKNVSITLPGTTLVIRRQLVPSNHIFFFANQGEPSFIGRLVLCLRFLDITLKQKQSSNYKYQGFYVAGQPSQSSSKTCRVTNLSCEANLERRE